MCHRPEDYKKTTASVCFVSLGVCICVEKYQVLHFFQVTLSDGVSAMFRKIIVYKVFCLIFISKEVDGTKVFVCLSESVCHIPSSVNLFNLTM